MERWIVIFLLMLNSFTAFGDTSQVQLPGQTAAPGSQPPKPATPQHPMPINPVFHGGGVGPSTVPNNVNQNGTVNTTPADIQHDSIQHIR